MPRTSLQPPGYVHAIINQTFAPHALSVLYDGVTPANWGSGFSAARRSLKAQSGVTAADALAARLRGAQAAAASSSTVTVTEPPRLADLPDPDNFINSTFSAQLSQPWSAGDGTTRAQLVIRAVNVFNANATVLLDVRGLANTTVGAVTNAAKTAAEQVVADVGRFSAAAFAGAGGEQSAVFSGEQWLLVGGNPNTWNTPSQPTVSAATSLARSHAAGRVTASESSAKLLPLPCLHCHTTNAVMWLQTPCRDAHSSCVVDSLQTYPPSCFPSPRACRPSLRSAHRSPSPSPPRCCCLPTPTPYGSSTLRSLRRL